jgi:hypothetical protein
MNNSAHVLPRKRLVRWHNGEVAWLGAVEKWKCRKSWVRMGKSYHFLFCPSYYSPSIPLLLCLNSIPVLAAAETGDGPPKDGEQLTPKCQICQAVDAEFKGVECTESCASVCEECVPDVARWIAGLEEISMEDGFAPHQIDRRLRCPVCRRIVTGFERVQ